MDFSKLPITSDNLKFLKTLQIGNSDFISEKVLNVSDDIHGKIFIVKNKHHPDKEYILKKIPLYHNTSEDLNILITSIISIENFIIGNCKYKDIFICYDSLFLTQDNKNIYINYVYEKAEGFSLTNMWPSDPEDLDFSLYVLIAYRLFFMLDILHKNNIYHRDIKPSNIVFNKDGTCHNFLKLIDFDFSCSKSCLSVPGTPAFFPFDMIIFGLEIKIDWQKTDIKSALLTVIKLYSIFNMEDTNLYDRLPNGKNVLNFVRLYTSTLHAGILRKNHGIKGHVLENKLLKFFVTLLGSDENLNAPYVLKNIEEIMHGCIPNEIKL